MVLSKRAARRVADVLVSCQAPGLASCGDLGEMGRRRRESERRGGGG